MFLHYMLSLLKEELVKLGEVSEKPNGGLFVQTKQKLWDFIKLEGNKYISANDFAWLKNRWLVKTNFS